MDVGDADGVTVVEVLVVEELVVAVVGSGGPRFAGGGATGAGRM